MVLNSKKPYKVIDNKPAKAEGILRDIVYLAIKIPIPACADINSATRAPPKADPRLTPKPSQRKVPHLFQAALLPMPSNGH